MSEVRSTGATSSSKLDVKALVLVAVLLAAGFILNLTVGKAFAIYGIQPEFIISSYCLAILIIRPNILQGALIGVLAATVIQITTSIPGVEYAADIPAGMVMAALCLSFAKGEKLGLFPGIATFITTVVSGGIFATIACLAILNLGVAGIITMVPVVLGTAVANTVVVQALYTPIMFALKRNAGGNLD